MNAPVKMMNGQRVVFAAGARHSICEELKTLGCKNALILSSPEQSDCALDLAPNLGRSAAGIYSRAAMHTPSDVTDDALAHAESVKADCLIALGGGSTIGLGKALSLRTRLPQIAIPTTYAGSEATPILGQTEDGVKTTLSNPHIIPDVVLYDPELLVSLPIEMTVASALNAMAHAAEALYAKDATAQTQALAVEGFQAFVDALPKILEKPNDLEARKDSLRGAWACGAVLGQVGMALHHKLCHTLGGSFGLPHAQTHAVILPHAVHYNAKVVPEALAPIIDVLGGDDPGLALWTFAKSLGAPMALRDLGLAEKDLDRAADLASQNPYWNPRTVTRGDLRALLQNAWNGTVPNV